MSIFELTMHYSPVAFALIIIYIKKSPVRRQRKIHISTWKNIARIFITPFITSERVCPILKFDLLNVNDRIQDRDDLGNQNERRSALNKHAREIQARGVCIFLSLVSLL